MSSYAPALATPTARAAGAPLTRALGVVGLLGAPAFLVQWAAAGFQAPNAPPPRDDVATIVTCAVYIVGFLAGAVGLRRLRATGRGCGAAALFAVQLALLLLAAGQPLQDAFGVQPLGARGYLASDLSWPLSHVLMLAVGAAVLRAGVLTGWRRWAPLACGTVVPLMLAAAAIGGRAAMGWVFCPGTALAFGALGLAVATARPAAGGR